MKFFKPEDFNYDNPIGIYSYEKMAELANAKLEREGKVMRNTSINGDVFNQGWSTARTYGDTHQALLINIEPIEKCTHPKEKVSAILTKEAFSKEFGVLLPVYKSEHYKCECGAVVEPKGFEEVK